jgi:hypothetical protein
MIQINVACPSHYRSKALQIVKLKEISAIDLRIQAIVVRSYGNWVRLNSSTLLEMVAPLPSRKNRS